MKVQTVFAALLVVAAILVAPPQAQAGAGDQGSIFVSGQLGLNYYIKSTTPEDSPTEGLDLLFAPRVLYFAGRSLGFGGEANLNMSFNGTKQTSLAIGLRAAYYLIPAANRYARGCCLTPFLGGNSFWIPFFGVSALYLMERYSYTGGYSSTASGFRGRAGLGVAPMIGDHGTAFLELGFQTQSLKYSGATTSQTSNKIYLEGGFGAFFFK